MAYDVFISYSHYDKPTADAICAKLESEGLRCWYAPRNIAPGEDWASTIIDGIKASKVFVVVFSSHSNGSQQVLREIGVAVNQKMPIIPFRLTNIVPSKGMEYYLSTVQWLDANDGPLYKNINALGNRIRAVLGAEGQQPGGPLSGSGLPPVSGATQTGGSGRNNKTGIIIAAAVLLLALIAVILWQTGVFSGGNPEKTPVPDVIEENVTEQETEAAPEEGNTAETAEEISEKPAETQPEAPTETPPVSPTEALTEAPTETPTEAPTEAPAETAAETTNEASAETSAQEDYPELRGMSEAKKKMVRNLIIAGDRVYINFVHEDYNEGFNTETQKTFLFVKEETIEIGPGTLTDLSILEGMDGLEVLYLLNQPLRSLDGIEKYQNLHEVRICGCGNLEDVSPLLQLEKLISLNLEGNCLKTVGSFEKLSNLSAMWIVDYHMEDLSGLSDLNVTSFFEEDGMILRLECPLVSDYSFLKKIPEFNLLQFYRADSAKWINELDQSRISQLIIFECFETQEDFGKLVEILVSDHPEMTKLDVAGNQMITDLSELAKMPNLSRVVITGDMWDAVCSLDNVDYQFELEVK